MPEPQDLLKHVHKYLSKTAVFSSFPMSLLLLGLEKLIEIECVCPCDKSTLLTVLIFTGPAIFTFALMYILLRPFKHCCGGVNDDTQQSCPKAFFSCLIPPVMWIFYLLLDGDYFACAMTDWKGVFVFDEELNRSWCKPTEGMRNETELRGSTRKYIHQSQVLGYIMIITLSALTIILWVFYDYWICSKNCKSHRQEGQDRRQGQGEAHPLQSANNDPV